MQHNKRKRYEIIVKAHRVTITHVYKRATDFPPLMHCCRKAAAFEGWKTRVAFTDTDPDDNHIYKADDRLFYCVFIPTLTETSVVRKSFKSYFYVHSNAIIKHCSTRSLLFI